jgi:hypothetical protein
MWQDYEAGAHQACRGIRAGAPSSDVLGQLVKERPGKEAGLNLFLLHLVAQAVVVAQAFEDLAESDSTAVGAVHNEEFFLNTHAPHHTAPSDVQHITFSTCPAAG